MKFNFNNSILIILQLKWILLVSLTLNDEILVSAEFFYVLYILH